MARFYLLESPDPVWINLDCIVSMYYDKEDNRTHIFSCDDPSECFTIIGDITNQILNANNEVTMHDKLFCSYFIGKIKGFFSSIISGIDEIKKYTNKRMRNEK